jgi:hypothetical protein
MYIARRSLHYARRVYNIKIKIKNGVFQARIAQTGRASLL